MTIELTARYHLTGDDCATVLIEGDTALALDDQAKGDPAAGILLTVLHECFFGETVLHTRTVSEDDLTGMFLLQLHVITGESLTFIARQQGRIIASLLSEVEAGESSRLLLYPKGGFDLVVHQQRCETPEEVQLMTERDQALIRTLTEPEPTGATVALADLIQAVERHYGADGEMKPAVLLHIQPALDQALALNEEAHSHEILELLCAALEELQVEMQQGIVGLYTVARL
jgi:hypothetical protein